MKTTDQLAEEAWMDVRANAWQLSGDHNAIGIGIIKAAIEKATKEVTKERDDLAAALQKLMKAVEINLLCGIPEIKTVDDVIRGMRTVADKLVQVSESRAHASEGMKSPEQWDKEGVCYASVAKKIQDNVLAALPAAAHASEPIDEDVLEGRVPPDLGTAHASERSHDFRPSNAGACCHFCGKPKAAHASKRIEHENTRH